MQSHSVCSTFSLSIQFIHPYVPFTLECLPHHHHHHFFLFFSSSPLISIACLWMAYHYIYSECIWSLNSWPTIYIFSKFSFPALSPSGKKANETNPARLSACRSVCLSDRTNFINLFHHILLHIVYYTLAILYGSFVSLTLILHFQSLTHWIFYVKYIYTYT